MSKGLTIAVDFKDLTATEIFRVNGEISMVKGHGRQCVYQRVFGTKSVAKVSEIRKDLGGKFDDQRSCGHCQEVIEES